MSTKTKVELKFKKNKPQQASSRQRFGLTQSSELWIIHADNRAELT